MRAPEENHASIALLHFAVRLAVGLSVDKCRPTQHLPLARAAGNRARLWITEQTAGLGLDDALHGLPLSRFTPNYCRDPEWWRVRVRYSQTGMPSW